jgi:hypothetical protein
MFGMLPGRVTYVTVEMEIKMIFDEYDGYETYS